MDDAIDVYSQLLDRFGDGVHKVFFGQPIDVGLWVDITTAVLRLAAPRPSLEDIGRRK